MRHGDDNRLIPMWETVNGTYRNIQQLIRQYVRFILLTCLNLCKEASNVLLLIVRKILVPPQH